MLTALFATALAIAPVPSPLDVTADELATLADRDVVVRHVDTETGGEAIGVIDVNAPVGRTMDAVLDVQARVGETSALKNVVIYGRTPPSATAAETMAVRFALKVVGSSVVFHETYEIDRASGWATFTLDHSQENDIVAADGSYHVYATDTGCRIVYRSSSDSGRNVPERISRWLANSALKDQLKGIRARAEGT